MQVAAAVAVLVVVTTCNIYSLLHKAFDLTGFWSRNNLSGLAHYSIDYTLCKCWIINLQYLSVALRT